MDKFLDLARESKKAVEHEDKLDTNWSWCAWNCHQDLENETGGTENQRKNPDLPDPRMVKIDLNTEKSPGDQSKLAATQTLMKPHQLKVVWKTYKEYNDNNDR